MLKLKQITEEDMKVLFEYPLQRIAEDENIMARLDAEGFENLYALLRKREFNTNYKRRGSGRSRAL